MNIDEMTTQEKSAVLARLRGWRKRPLTTEQIKLFYGDRLSGPSEAWQDDEGHWLPQGLPDFYSTGNMAQAWGVHLWANATTVINWAKYLAFVKYRDWWEAAVVNCDIFRADFAPRAWLDKILELAIEAGMVDDD